MAANHVSLYVFFNLRNLLYLITLAVLPAVDKQFLCIGSVSADLKAVGEWKAGCGVERIVLESDDASPQAFLTHDLLHLFHRRLPFSVSCHPLRILADFCGLIDTLTIGKIGIDSGSASRRCLLDLFYSPPLRL